MSDPAQESDTPKRKKPSTQTNLAASIAFFVLPILTLLFSRSQLSSISLSIFSVILLLAMYFFVRLGVQYLLYRKRRNRTARAGVKHGRE